MISIGTQQKILTLMFRCIQPEILYRSIKSMESWRNEPPELSVENVSLDLFQSIAHEKYPTYAFEEIQNVYSIMKKQMAQLPNYIQVSQPSVFYLLLDMGKRVLKQNANGLICRFSEMLAWRTAYQDLGQDLFTTSYLAYQDIQQGIPERFEFTWEAALKTDNAALNGVLCQGLSENHCHLGGTTQVFPLSWACLMNCPQTIGPTSEILKRNLQAVHSRGYSENVWPWEKRIQWAAYIRVVLFNILEERCQNKCDLDMFKSCFVPEQDLRREVELARFCYGAKVAQIEGTPLVLDYALRQTDCTNGLLNHPLRLLSGERSFMYRCFRACFDGRFKLEEQNYFYLYLLIKSNLRAEFVQVNGQIGFHNFKDYQDRKGVIYNSFPAYNAEAIRLSVIENLQSQRLTSFEARIAPKDSVKVLYNQILISDRVIDSAGGIPHGNRFFYVYHFQKEPDDGNRPDLPRNYAVRKKVAEQAKALAFALSHSRKFSQRVFGIDAASLEIGCRPETFSTEFRYLRSIKSIQSTQGICDQSPAVHIHSTYHVGEDFLDIADGLRAIDEAIHFLELKRGDRLGHALALGVDPEVHYSMKTRRITLPKQDLLDNAVWLLYRTEELGVEMSQQLFRRLRTLAETLLFEIYGYFVQGMECDVSLNEYFHSMKLRGDSPELYYVLPYEQHQQQFLDWSYESFRERRGEDLGRYRKSSVISGLYQCYHYMPEVKCAGQVICEYKVDEDYIELIRALQERMMLDIEKRGIMIECNPTSNYLIGTFRRYDRHPILRFHNAGLVQSDSIVEPSPQLSVSINTDDLGIFDTTLENEYAILAASLERATTESGKKKYTSDSIYKYLNSIRRMGFEQSFALAEEYYESFMNAKKRPVRVIRMSHQQK